MKLQRKRILPTVVGVSALVAALFLVPLALADGPPRADHEVWILDQSDTSAAGGGHLYIYSGAALSSPAAIGRPELAPERIDLAQAAAGVGDGVGRRAHMILFNPEHSHAIIANVATGHVYIMRAADRTVVASIQAGLPEDAMRQAHAAFPTPDSSLILIANQNGKKLERIFTNYATETFTHDPTDHLDLAALESERQPDNAPICPMFADDRHAFITLRGGGLLVVDVQATPMQIIASFDNDVVAPNGCGGALSADGTTMYINSGGGTPANPLAFDLYAFDVTGLSGPTPAVGDPVHIFHREPASPAPNCVEDQEGCTDSHGLILVRDRFLWVADRAADELLVFDTRTNELANTIDLGFKAAPDLLGVSPAGTRVYISQRGPSPLTANAPGVNNAVGTMPGLGVVLLGEAGREAIATFTAPISHVVDGAERADPHGLAVRTLRPGK